ncbi:MAG TPA: hypothetical protein VFH07_13130, partial [Chitinophagaceae bacterium]|nr:hypothetical protein [Chitinophagaceae bacterium]
ISTLSFKDKMKLLLEQANEHRIVYDRIWTIISYKVFRTINFNFLSFVGNLSLVGIAILYFNKFRGLGKPLYLFIPITVLLFNFASWENITFAMAGLSNFTVFLFMLLSLHFLTSNKTKNKTNLLLSILFLIFALFTQGGALSLVPVSIFILIYKKQYKNLWIYLISVVIILGLYFYDYDSPQHNGTIIDTLRELKGRMILFVFSFLGNALNYFLIYTSNQQESLGITAIAGFCFFALFLYITKTKYYQRNLFNYSLMLLIVLSACLTALNRSSFGWDFAAASRYRINGIIFLISIYFWFLETYRVDKKKTSAIILALTGLYFIGINLNHYEYLGIREQQTNFGIIGYNSGKPDLLNGDKTQIELYTKILRQSDSLNTYRLPTNADLEYYYPYSKKMQTPVVTDDPKLEMPFSVREIYQLADDYFIDGFAFINGYSANNQKVYLGFKSAEDKEPVFFSTKQIARYDLNTYFNKFTLKDGGYQARIHMADIKPGENKIWLLVSVDGKVKMLETDKKITK